MLREVFVMRGDEVDGVCGGWRLVQWQDGARLESPGLACVPEDERTWREG